MRKLKSQPKIACGLGLFNNHFVAASVEIQSHGKIPRRHKFRHEPPSNLNQKIKQFRELILALPCRIKERRNKDCALLKLPAEIRQQVYQFLFANPVLVVTFKEEIFWEGCNLNVLLTCRLVHKEAIDVLRANTTLQLRTHVDMALPIAYIVNQLPLPLLKGLIKMEIVIDSTKAQSLLQANLSSDYGTLHNFPVRKFHSLKSCHITVISHQIYPMSQHADFKQRTGKFENTGAEMNPPKDAPWNRYGFICLTRNLARWRGNQNVRFFIRRRKGFVFMDRECCCEKEEIPNDALVYVQFRQMDVNDGRCVHLMYLQNESFKERWEGDLKDWQSWVLAPLSLAQQT
jgi:hypothetical protein